MTGKFAVVALVWAFVGSVGPLCAQSMQVQLDALPNARTTQPLAARIGHVDVRLLMPFHSDSNAVTSIPPVDEKTPVPQVGESHRARNAIIGGVLGTVVGLGACTAISNLMDDSAKRRVSTCTATGNLIFGAGGFAVGALIGAAIK